MDAVTPPAPAATAPDLASLKARQKAAWSSGDYAVIGTTLQIVGESLCEALDLRAGQAVLDVAAGNGNASLAAARRFCHVTALDYVPALLARAGERARADRLELTLREADAEALPFPDAAFDAVMSPFGVMFAPDQERAAAEMARVCAPGGRIGLACWTPEGFVGQLFRTVGHHVPPPPGVDQPYGRQPRQADRQPPRSGTSREDDGSERRERGQEAGIGQGLGQEAGDNESPLSRPTFGRCPERGRG